MFNQNQKVSQETLDARQETQIWTSFALNPYLAANDIKVSVREGKATLSGNVADDVNKELARQIALGVSGIKALDNDIEVQANYMPPTRPVERGFGEIVGDATITATVKSKMLWSRHNDGIKANVETARGKVTLSGSADSSEARDFATKIAANTQGVHSVDNQLVVGFEKSGVVSRTMGADIADGWITTKVKSTFMYSSNVDGSDFAVSTNGGIVKLTGKTDSAMERAAAIELAGNVRGVKSVDSSSLTM